MSYFEVVYEPGGMSVVDASDRRDAILGIREHHQRAMHGQPAHPEPSGGLRPAERIVLVMEYEDHPHELSAPTSLSNEVAQAHVADLLELYTEDGVVDLIQVAAHLVPQPLAEFVEPHDSKYTAEGKDITDEVLVGMG